MSVALSLITSRDNQRVKQLRAALAQPPPAGMGIIGIEGKHLLAEALRSGLSVQTVFLSESHDPPLDLPDHVDLLRLSEGVFRSVSATQSPQGIAAILHAPTFSLDQALGHTTSSAHQRVPLLLVVDSLQDPGNLGTLVRSAEAFGGTGVLMLPGSTSPWNGKALRASAGSAFRLPTLPCTLEVVRDLTSHGVHLLAAVGHSTTAQPSAVPELIDLTQPTAFLIGNEGAGLSRELLAFAPARVTIPCTGPVESLNAAVAGSLLLFAAQQQRSRAGAPTRGAHE